MVRRGSNRGRKSIGSHESTKYLNKARFHVRKNQIIGATERISNSWKDQEQPENREITGKTRNNRETVHCGPEKLGDAGGPEKLGQAGGPEKLDHP